MGQYWSGLKKKALYFIHRAQSSYKLAFIFLGITDVNLFMTNMLADGLKLTALRFEFKLLKT